MPKSTSTRKQSPKKKASRTQGMTVKKDELIKLYRAMLLPRMVEEKMLILLRQGKVSKWFSGIGQEAIAVGCTEALYADEYILPLHRNLGVFTSRGIPLWKLMAQWQGKATGFTNGRDRSFHFGTREYGIVGMISHLGPQLCVADGIALASKLKKEKKVTLVFSGEGGTSEGDFHEALNVAAVWDLPVIFVVESNGYALSTPVEQQFRCKSIADKGVGYGIEAYSIDGNDILAVYGKVKMLSESLRKKPRPVLLECRTFRMRGHEEASGTKYVPKKLLDEWGKRDPVSGFEKHLLKRKVLNKGLIEKMRSEVLAYIEESVERAFCEEEVSADPERELIDVYAPLRAREPGELSESSASVPRRFVDAISDGLRDAMRRNPSLVLMGQDIADYGGVFKITDGFVKEFGKDRVRNTPLCESAILGASLGLSVKGVPSVVEMQFADFVSSGFNQIVNNLAKSHYRWGQNAGVVVRMPTGAGTGAGPFHSQSNEAWFTHVPGLKVVYPSTPHDAKGLLLAAIEDPNPVMFFEHKALYRSVSGEVPSGYYTVPIGEAHLARSGDDAVIITYGAGVAWALEAAEAVQDRQSVAVLDLRSLLPLDYGAIEQAVRATSRVLILHEDTLFGGIGGEIAAYVGQHLFSHLDAPIIRVGSLDTPVPFAEGLERQFLAKQRLQSSLESLLTY
jgi:2-oxoisovalerate dehydrogenase E1 component